MERLVGMDMGGSVALRLGAYCGRCQTGVTGWVRGLHVGEDAPAAVLQMLQFARAHEHPRDGRPGQTVSTTSALHRLDDEGRPWPVEGP